MIAILWRYRVRPERVTEFERVYGRSGDWATLFSQAEGYLNTELLRERGGIYLTIDHWRSQADFDRFIAMHRGAYDALDVASDGMMIEEMLLGVLEAVC